MGQHALVALNDVLLDVGGIVGGLEPLLAEAADASQVGDMILPGAHAQLEVELLFPAAHTVAGGLGGVEAVGGEADGQGG